MNDFLGSVMTIGGLYGLIIEMPNDGAVLWRILFIIVFLVGLNLLIQGVVDENMRELREDIDEIKELREDIDELE